MDRSKLFEWLMENDCPFEWEVDYSHDEAESCKLIFTKDD